MPAGTTPLTASAGVTVKLTPLQTAAVIGLIAGLGFTVSVNVNDAPVQPPNPAGEAGIIVYVAVCGELVVLVSVPVMLVGVPTLAAPPVMPPVTTGAAQVYVVPAGTTPFVPSEGVTVKPVPVHTDSVIAVTAGLGLTVTVTVNVAPVQLPRATEVTGVTV